jgi:hypothetical protein
MDVNYQQDVDSGEQYLTLNSILRSVIDSVLKQVHTAIPASVVSFDLTSMSATVKPLIKVQNKDGTFLSVSQVYKVPVMFPRTAISCLSYPISAKDTGLLLFSERSFDTWIAGDGKEVEPEDIRHHDLQDCVFIPGLFPTGKGKIPVNNDDLVIQHNNSTITIKKNGDLIAKNDGNSITITNSGDIKIGSSALSSLVVDSFIDSFNNFLNTTFNVHTHICASPSSPSATPLPVAVPVVKNTVITQRTKAQ